MDAWDDAHLVENFVSATDTPRKLLLLNPLNKGKKEKCSRIMKVIVLVNIISYSDSSLRKGFREELSFGTTMDFD